MNRIIMPRYYRTACIVHDNIIVALDYDERDSRFDGFKHVTLKAFDGKTFWRPVHEVSATCMSVQSPPYGIERIILRPHVKTALLKYRASKVAYVYEFLTTLAGRDTESASSVPPMP